MSDRPTIEDLLRMCQEAAPGLSWRIPPPLDGDSESTLWCGVRALVPGAGIRVSWNEADESRVVPRPVGYCADVGCPGVGWGDTAPHPDVRSAISAIAESMRAATTPNAHHWREVGEALAGLLKDRGTSAREEVQALQDDLDNAEESARFRLGLLVGLGALCGVETMETPIDLSERIRDHTVALRSERDEWRSKFERLHSADEHGCPDCDYERICREEAVGALLEIGGLLGVEYDVDGHPDHGQYVAAVRKLTVERDALSAEAACAARMRPVVLAFADGCDGERAWWLRSIAARGPSTVVAVCPIPMVLHCPRCGLQHVDAPDGEWTNPPHRSHKCHNPACVDAAGQPTVWRPADVQTVGVERVQTRGSVDTWDGSARRVGRAPAEGDDLAGFLDATTALALHDFPDALELLNERIADSGMDLPDLTFRDGQWVGEDLDAFRRTFGSEVPHG